MRGRLVSGEKHIQGNRLELHVPMCNSVEGVGLSRQDYMFETDPLGVKPALYDALTSHWLS